MTHTIIVIPDTQALVAYNYPAEWEVHLHEAVDWIIAHKEALNIQAVLHAGDIVHNHTVRSEFEAASAALNRLKTAGIPFIPCRGNHDGVPLYNEFFGFATFQTFSEVGKYDEDDACNYYVELVISGEPHLFFSLDFGPTDAVMEWASGEIQNHPDHHVMIITHSYMFGDGTRVSPGDQANPKLYYSYPVNDGEDMWQNYLKCLPNVRCVFSGHHLLGNVSHRVDLNDSGLPVFQSFQNWQSAPEGGSGRFCLYEFTPPAETGNVWNMVLRAYDPAAGIYMPIYEQSFVFDWPGELNWAGVPRFGFSRYSTPGTLQSRAVTVTGESATVDAQAYLAAAPSYLVPGARRFGLIQFSAPGTLQSRHMAVEGAEVTIVATRDPLVAADRLTAIAGLGGYLAGRSYAVPDVSGGVSVAFEEVYPI